MPRLSKIGAAALAAFGWTSGSAVSASYLVVAGAGGGGNGLAGGGGAGGLLSGTASLNPTLSYTITVGAGGTGSTSISVKGSSGSNSVFNAVTSIGGGGGGSNASLAGVSGGSGGGGSGGGAGATGGTGTAGQGNAGGDGVASSPYPAGAGGGAGAVGGTGSGSASGAGGVGVASSISGTSTYYAGGGGGGGNVVYGASAGAGGNGGGGAGVTAGNGNAGTANLGGGGGGGGYTSGSGSANFGGSGGSGIVIISYVGAQQFSGGVVTSSGGNTIHTFTTSGTLGPVTPLSANYLVVAGGGGGGYFGGGGAGGLLSGSALTIDPYSTYLVAVGAGGTGSITTIGASGTNSAFSMVSTTAVGGGGGGSYGSPSGIAALNGGSGGGGGVAENGTPGAPGTGTSGQGNAGGVAGNRGGVGSYPGAGGGGGAGAVGNTFVTTTGGAGGAGLASSISGSSVTYAGGGGGSGYNGTGGAGGAGGGGAGGTITAAAIAGTANTGGGGGGNNATTSSGNGGSGVVIISYAGSTQLMAGGVVTIASGNVIHTFNSSGYLTPLTLLTRSLRFRGAYPTAPSYLSRTARTPTNNLKWTYSLWVKRGVLGVGQFFLNGGTGTSASEDYLAFFGSDKIAFGQANSSSTYLLTASVYRDPAAWYHIVFVYDSAQATASNRALFYVNGVQVTSFSNATYPTLNQSTNINANGVLQRISSRTYLADEGFDGYMAEVNFIDGQALAPTAFGTVNSYGVWQPITYGGSYGNNGFRLPFTDNASTTTLGYDFSPQGNNWTTNNISVTAGSTYDSMTDVPTMTSATAANYCVWNAVAQSTVVNGTVTRSNGNLTSTDGGTTYGLASFGTIASTTGKWYWEVTLTTAPDAYANIGVVDLNSPLSAGTHTGICYRQNNGYKDSGSNVFNGGGAGTAYGATYAAGDVIGVALDLTAGTITFYKNGTSQGVAYTSISGNYAPAVGDGQNANSYTFNLNCGQRPFTYTPPTGYLALNTFNL